MEGAVVTVASEDLAGVAHEVAIVLNGSHGRLVKLLLRGFEGGIDCQREGQVGERASLSPPNETCAEMLEPIQEELALPHSYVGIARLAAIGVMCAREGDEVGVLLRGFVDGVYMSLLALYFLLHVSRAVIMANLVCACCGGGVLPLFSSGPACLRAPRYYRTQPLRISTILAWIPYQGIFL